MIGLFQGFAGHHYSWNGDASDWCSHASGWCLDLLPQQKKSITDPTIRSNGRSCYIRAPINRPKPVILCIIKRL